MYVKILLKLLRKKEIIMLLNILLRGGIPLLIMSGIALILYLQNDMENAKSTFIVGWIIFFVGAASIIYNFNGWSITKQSAVHFLVMVITIFPLLLISGWFDVSSALAILKVFFIFLSFGIILWL